MIQQEDIRKNCISWAQEYISPDFKFRKYQLETVVKIIYNILTNKNPTQIIEAPTGSGKSLINIISAGVLSKYYEKSSYILCSDLFLWSQYNDFIKVHPKINKEFGVIKGQEGNYRCKANLEDIKLAKCKMASMSWDQLFNSEMSASCGFSCAKTCAYVQERKKAVNSNVTLMTYALYYYMIDRITEGKQFCGRDVVFCDECHNIPDIFSNLFKPSLVGEHLNYLKTIASSLFTEELEIKFFSIYYGLQQDDNSAEEDLRYIEDYLALLKEYNSMSQEALSYIQNKTSSKLTSEDKKLYNAVRNYSNLLDDWTLYLNTLKKAGFENVVKSVTINRDPDKIVVGLKCAKEDWLCWEFLLRTTPNCVMLSATVGGFDAFSQNIGVGYTELGYAETARIPSTFDYSKSPIIFLNWWKMSHAYKKESFPNLQLLTYQICKDKHPNSKGLIQTGSYANAIELYKNAPADIKSRMLLYTNSREKEAIIRKHCNSSKPTILVGPSLAEGINLPDDLCRFIVILKVPYPVIVDEYVKKKMELFPMWYESVTSNKIIQGIGRGIRNEKDYCETFILDACFQGLYQNTKSQYPIELQNRILTYNRKN